MTHLWPVIHVDTLELACVNAAMAARCGVKGVFLIGVFLIHMQGQDEVLDPIAEHLRALHPSLLLGVNYLSLSANEALRRAISMGYDASWSDKPGVRSDGVSPHTQEMARLLTEHPQHQFFASVAFKYQKEDPDPGEAAKRAWALGMIPTTSGVATGSAPELGKLDAIRRTIGPEAPLALASGVDNQNIDLLSPYLSDVLVSTGISADFHTFDEALLHSLAQKTKMPGYPGICH